MCSTGAHPSIPNSPGAELGGSSDDVFAWEDSSESIAILGAGYRPVELAGVLHTFGVNRSLCSPRYRPTWFLFSYIVEGLVKEMERTLTTSHSQSPCQVRKNYTDGITIH